MCRVMISQPRYLPSLTYLRRIAKADVFIVYDNVQRVSRGWENRNKMLTKEGVEKWLTIPISSGSRELIKSTKIADVGFYKEHRDWICLQYDNNGGADYFNSMRHCMGADYTQHLIAGLKHLLHKYDIRTQVVRSSDLSEVVNGGNAELISLIKKVGGTTYVSGPNCEKYGLTEEVLKENGIRLEIDTWVPESEHPYLPVIHHELRCGANFVYSQIHES